MEDNIYSKTFVLNERHFFYISNLLKEIPFYFEIGNCNIKIVVPIAEWVDEESLLNTIEKIRSSYHFQELEIKLITDSVNRLYKFVIQREGGV